MSPQKRRAQKSDSESDSEPSKTKRVKTEPVADKSGSDESDGEEGQPGMMFCSPKKTKSKPKDKNKDKSRLSGDAAAAAAAASKPTKPKTAGSSASASRVRKDSDSDFVGSSGIMAPTPSVPEASSFANNPDCEFWLQITHPSQLIQMINIANDTLIEASFKIVRTAEFAGIQIISIDTHHVALVRTHLECIMLKAPPMDQPVSFRIKISALKTLLSQVSTSSVIEWGGYFNSDKHVMFSYERDAGSYVRNFEIPLIANNDAGDLPPITVRAFAFTVEMELGQFKDFVRCAKDLKAEKINFKILEHVDAKSKMTTHYLILLAAGDMVSKCTFRSQSAPEGVQEDKDGNKVPVLIRTSNSLEATQNAHSEFQKDEAKCTTVYSESFPCEYLSNFVKSMNKTNIVLELLPGEPMWLKYSLAAKSFIELICSPQLSDDEI